MHAVTLAGERWRESRRLFGMGKSAQARCRWMKADIWKRERRLAYVGVTRAMQNWLTYAETRRLYGKEVSRPSRFIGELPEGVEVRLRATVSRPVSHQRMGTPIVENDSGYKLGQRVRHAKFGEGTIRWKIWKAADDVAVCRSGPGY